MSNAHTETVREPINLENEMGLTETFAALTSRKAESVGEFDSKLSYGQTRAALMLTFERQYVSWLLERQRGNISAAAREARMDRKHLHDLAKKHGLREPPVISLR